MNATVTEAPPPGNDRLPGRGTERTLLVLAALPAVVRADGHWMLPTKLVSGMRLYAERWPGRVVLGLPGGDTLSDALDNAPWDPAMLPFGLLRLSFADLAARGHPILDNATVLAMLHHDLHGLAQLCRQQNARLVVNTELTLNTQLQIARASQPLGPGLLKAVVWLLLNHRRALREIGLAHGLQCNGTPTFDAFAHRNPHPLLYLDNRTTRDMLATPQHQADRARRIAERGRLRLLFSGRLHPIKGAHHLLPMAEHLRRMGVDFELVIAGDGPLRPELERQIQQRGLHPQVQCLGALDFATELMPLLRETVDLFVCPHLQGDPSCTYLETLSGGVPIAGYPNEAWQGLQRRSQAGVVCRGSQPQALAEAVAALLSTPDRLTDLSTRALAFAASHLFETEFDARISHLQRVSAGKAA